MSEHTYIQYFIPHDGDGEEHPNVFLLRRPATSLKIGDIRGVSCDLLKSFP
jgi:hypothetical protein